MFNYARNAANLASERQEPTRKLVRFHPQEGKKKDRWKASGPSLGRKRQGGVKIRLIRTAG